MRIRNLLWLLLLAFFGVGSANVLASPADDHGGNMGHSPTLTTDLMPIPPTMGRGDGQYFELGMGSDTETVLNANVRLALERLDEDGDTVLLNTHLGITVENYQDAVITLFTGTDEDGDGTCLQEGPTSICVLVGGDNLEVSPTGILHATWALTLREKEDGSLLASGTCWSNFESVAVIPQVDEDGNMTSIVFEVKGGEEAMPVIADKDGSMVGFGAPWLGFESIDCGVDDTADATSVTTCEIIPILMGQWND